ncbi:MAG: prolipoprotein diacylglyceryl transferase [Anaerolineae bacterium]|nr:prolipoprotein diacylglyceryl transferase [Anaerolineae bacterium]
MATDQRPTMGILRRPKVAAKSPIAPMAYPYILITGTLTGILFSLLLGHRKGLPAWTVLDGALAAGIGGLLVGRILYVLAHLAYFQEHPAEALALWRGGLSGFGSVVGGSLGLLALIAWRRENPRLLLNVLAPGASLVVLAAWAGCLQAGCAWGRETGPSQGLLWHLSLDLPDLYGLRAPRVAVQGMGILLGIVLLFASCLALRFRWRNIGPLWLLLYSLGDFALSSLRGDLSPGPGGLSLLQWADLGLFVGTLLVFAAAKPLKRKTTF